MTFEDILYEVRNGVAWITINRADKMNAFRGTTCDEIIKAMNKAGYDREVGCIVLAGAGDRAFCTGGDQSAHDGNYDGRYAWINDKINARAARIRLDYFVCDKITDLPNVQGFHGIFPDKADPVDAAINYTTRVFCGGEFSIPLPNTEIGTAYVNEFRGQAETTLAQLEIASAAGTGTLASL